MNDSFLLFFIISFQNPLNDPRRKARGKYIEKEKQGISVHLIYKPRALFFEYFCRYLTYFLSFYVARLDLVYYILEALGVTGVELCVLAEAVKCRRRYAEHTCVDSARTEHRHGYTEQLHLHTQSVCVLVERALRYRIYAGEGQGIEWRKLACGYDNSASRVE